MIISVNSGRSYLQIFSFVLMHPCPLIHYFNKRYPLCFTKELFFDSNILYFCCLIIYAFEIKNLFTLPVYQIFLKQSDINKLTKMEYYIILGAIPMFSLTHDNLVYVSILRNKKCGLESMYSLLKSHSATISMGILTQS